MNPIDQQIQYTLHKMAERHENPGLDIGLTFYGATLYVARQKQKLARGESLNYGEKIEDEPTK